MCHTFTCKYATFNCCDQETAGVGRRESDEDVFGEPKYDLNEKDVLTLVDAIREAAVEKSRKGKESKVQVTLLLRQCLASVMNFQGEGDARNNVASEQRCGLEESKARVKRWCAELKERKMDKWCEECCVYISAPNFRRHRRLMHSREKSAVCPVPECGKNFYHNRYLEDHLRLAHGFDNLQCAEKYHKTQGVQLETEPKVKVEDCPQEKVLGTMKPRFQCDECDLTFAAGSLMQHKKAAHRGEKNAKCPEAGCGKRYRYKNQLKDHMRAVHNLKKLECTQCEAKFSSHSGHTAHQTRCRGPKSGHLSCMFPNCREKFTSVKQLKLHCKERHSSIVEFVCDVPGCSKAYDTKYKSEMHKEKVHKQVRQNKMNLLNFFDSFQVKFEAVQDSLKNKNYVIEKKNMEEDHAKDIAKGGDTKNEELSEEEDVGAIQKWLEENSKGTLASTSEGEVEVQEISIEIF